MFASVVPPARATLISPSSVSPGTCGIRYVAMRIELGFAAVSQPAGTFQTIVAASLFDGTGAPFDELAFPIAPRGTVIAPRGTVIAPRGTVIDGCPGGSVGIGGSAVASDVGSTSFALVLSSSGSSRAGAPGLRSAKAPVPTKVATRANRPRREDIGGLRSQGACRS
jgi:hypothetical protein